MKKKICLIALDSADIRLIKKWSSEGYLPNLNHIIKNGSLLQLNNSEIFRNEIPWESLLTGSPPSKTGFWTPMKFNEQNYEVRNTGAYTFEKYLPFYAKLPGKTINVFDIPHCGTIFPSIPGIQALGWGAHSPMCNKTSNPSNLIKKIVDKFGNHPAVKIQNFGCWWDESVLHQIYSTLIDGIRLRGKVLNFLIENFPEDLMFFSFGDIHIASHHFWHLADRSHPLFNKNISKIPNLLLDIYKEADRQLGLLIEKLPGSTRVIILSPMGGEQSWSDLNSMIFLPEFLYRWNFPNQKLFNSISDSIDNQPVIPDSKYWVRTVWTKYFDNIPPAWIPNFMQKAFRKLAKISGLHYPFYVLRLLGQHQWHPSVWYKPWWPKMKAFALPGYGDGYIRLNLKGRELNGIVEPNEVESICNELKEKLLLLRNPVSGERLVDKIFIMNKDLNFIHKDKRPDADIIVNWNLKSNDSVVWDGSEKLGPVPFWKSGSHNPIGFILAKDILMNPGIKKKNSIDVIDVAPSILSLMDVALPEYMKKNSIFMNR